MYYFFQSLREVVLLTHALPILRHRQSYYTEITKMIKRNYVVIKLSFSANNTRPTFQSSINQPESLQIVFKTPN